MSYEKSAITESPSAIPSAAPLIMREEREVDPYRRTSGGGRNQIAATGQPNISSDKVSPEEPKDVPAETVTLSPQMAALARKEQKFRREQQELRTREAQLQAERKEIDELKALKAKLQNKDYSGIEDLVKYEDYTNYLIEKESSLSPEQVELKRLQAKVDGVEKAQKDDVTKRFEAAVSERRKAVTSLVESNEEFSSIKELKMEEAVVQHILDTWENDNIDLSPEDAAREVEQELIERANKWTALSKLKAKSAAPEAEEKKQLPPLKPGIKTLTNNMSATGEIKRPVKSFQHMNDQERYAEARRRAEERIKLNGGR